MSGFHQQVRNKGCNGPMIIEDILMLLLACAIIFGVLWVVVEGGTKLGEMFANRK